MNKTEKQKFDLEKFVSRIEQRNEGESIISFVRDNNLKTKKTKGRPKKNAVIPEGEKETRYTFIVNESNLNRLQDIAHVERFQMKAVFNSLIELFISEYESQTKNNQ